MKKTFLFTLQFYFFLFLSYSQNTIEGYEYWFNNDFDNKIITNITPIPSLNVSFNVPTNVLNTGVHTFNFRTFDSEGYYSSVLSQFFYKVPQSISNNREIVAYEYWFDNDFDNASTIATSVNQNVNINDLINAQSLDAGIHVLNIRFKDNSNLWSSVASQFFYKVPESNINNREIVAYEYWFDNDFVNASTIATSINQNVSISTLIDVQNLNTGIHVFNIRFKDNSNLWSSVFSQFFYRVPEFINNNINNKIFAYKYWLNDDIINATNIELTTPIKNLNLIENIDFTQIPKGEYALNFQFRDSIGLWSSVVTDSIEKISLPIADFDFVKTDENCNFTTIQFTNNSIDGDEYTWDFGDNNQSTDENSQHTYTEAGVYTVSLYILDTITGIDSLFTQTISITGESFGNITIIECDSFVTPAGNTYSLTGIYNDTLIGQNAFSCDSIITIDLTINQSVSTFENLTSCNPSDTGVFIFNGQTNFNCDSIHTRTVSLLPSSATFENLNSCNPADTGIVVLNLQNQFMCDSIHTITTSLLPSDNTMEVLTSCNLSDTGVVILNLQNQFLCDSTHTIITSYEEWDIDVSVDISNNILTSNASGVNYTWINCASNQPIPDANEQSFVAIENGTYAVRLSSNGCEATSDCYSITGVGIQDDLLKSLKVYPNPTNNAFFIDLSLISEVVEIEIFDFNGSKISASKSNGNSIEKIELRGSAGVYFIKLKTVTFSKVLKIVKQD